MAPTAAQQVEERALKSRSARGPCAWPCAGAKGGGQLGLSLNCLPWSGLQWPLRLAARPARWWFGQLPFCIARNTQQTAAHSHACIDPESINLG